MRSPRKPFAVCSKSTALSTDERRNHYRNSGSRYCEVKVAVKADEAGEETTIELSVAKDDMGKVIGKQGRIAKAIRTVVRAASVKREKKYRVDIL